MKIYHLQDKSFCATSTAAYRVRVHSDDFWEEFVSTILIFDGMESLDGGNFNGV